MLCLSHFFLVRVFFKHSGPTGERIHPEQPKQVIVKHGRCLISESSGRYGSEAAWKKKGRGNEKSGESGMWTNVDKDGFQ